MKNLVIITIMILFGMSSALADSTADMIEKHAQNKDYPEAAALIPQAVSEDPDDTDLLVLCGDVYVEMEEIEKALEMYQRADKSDRDEPRIMRKVARTLSILGKTQEALEIINDALKEDNKDIHTVIEKGMIYVRADNFQKATLEFNNAKAINKDMPQIYVALGDLYYKKGIFDMARKQYEEALTLDPTLINARINLAESYSSLANKSMSQDLIDEYFNKSLKEWNIVGKEDPKNARAFFRQGKIFYQASRYGDAAKAFNKYVQLRPKGSYGRWLLAESLYEYRQYKDAIQHLEIVRNEIDSVKNKATLMIARSYAKIKNVEGAKDKKLENYKTAIKYFNEYQAQNELDDVDDYEILAIANMQIGDTVKAFAAFENLFEKDTTNIKLMGYYASKLYGVAEYAKAYKYFSMVANNLPDSSDNIEKMLYYSGTCQRFMGNPVLAIAIFNKVIAIDPTFYKSKISIGDSYQAIADKDSTKEMKKEHIDQAIANYNYVIDNAIQDTTQKVYVSQAFGKIVAIYTSKEYRDFNEIGKYAHRWTQFDPKYSMAWFYYGLSFHGKKDIENACRYYRKAIQLDGKNKYAKKQYKALNCNGG